MEEFIYFKILKKEKYNEKNFEKYLNKNLLKNKRIYIHINKKIELPNEFSEIDMLSISYKIEGMKYVKENKNIIKADINKENIEIIKNNIDKWMKIGIIDKIFICKEEKGIIEINVKDKQIFLNFFMMPKIKILAISILIILIMIFLLVYKFKFVVQVYNNDEIGIIDGAYTIKFDNVIYNKLESISQEKTHGDHILEFAKKLCNNMKIYYYDATSIDNKINSNNIILGLEYMKEKGIKIINISLSSKNYSSEIEDWIKNNPEIKVYASYNNLENTFDYPAMYEGVIGSGKKSKIKYKENDKKHISNEIIILPNIFKIYKGNSYLSFYDAINDEYYKNN